MHKEQVRALARLIIFENAAHKSELLRFLQK
jgi:hypothetical protein